MVLLIISVTTVLIIWGVCSLAEASIYAVQMPYVRQLEQANADSGKILARFKANMERPISAILVVNTVVAAAGATIAGAQASRLFGEARLWWFSVCFTVAALFISEIIPKIVGVAYNRTIARLLAKPLLVAVVALYPVIWVIERASVFMKPRVPLAIAPEDEVQQLAEISAEEGSIMPYEADLVRNVLDLDKVTAREIMTPASVVTKLADHLTLRDVAQQRLTWEFSRIPIYCEKTRLWTGFVLSRDVLATIAQDRFDLTLDALAKKLYFVRDNAPGHKLLSEFLKRRTHIFGVVGTNGQVVGIVTLEDVLESVIGAEIVDEMDTIVDMQEFAQRQRHLSDG